MGEFKSSQILRITSRSCYLEDFIGIVRRTCVCMTGIKQPLVCFLWAETVCKHYSLKCLRSVCVVLSNTKIREVWQLSSFCKAIHKFFFELCMSMKTQITFSKLSHFGLTGKFVVVVWYFVFTDIISNHESCGMNCITIIKNGRAWCERDRCAFVAFKSRLLLFSSVLTYRPVPSCSKHKQRYPADKSLSSE